MLYSPKKFVQIIIWKIIETKWMKKNNETISLTQKNAQERSQSTGRLNIEDINRRNAEERRQEKKSLYIVAGIIVAVFIVIALYFFS